MTLASMSHPEATAGRLRLYYREQLGAEAEAFRAAEIASLPSKEWHGRTLYRLRCHGTSGKGPHDYWVPEAMCWALIGLDPFWCVYHAGDAWGAR